ncbi:MAG: tryptophan--tRNA ligase [Bacteroidales bacterium]|nr:tryptophan--tRNA ligase [Bacteroidales bacterium]MDE7072657.1 tryptophan--tRNA ligase [Bacteroidales bacterium]
MEKKIVVSGIRPTGNLHLGNYFGALRNFIRMQNEYDCYFFIADYHSLTTHPHPEHLRQNVKDILATYVACGVDPEKVAIYAQSDVPETAELYLFLNMNAYLGELERCTSFKDKARQNPNNVNAGLLTYPSLMAADILIHKADFVPVGKDQEQHLEMTRVFAQRFNHMYGTEYFGQPQAFNFGNNLVKIPGLDGSGKMGKSESGNNAVFLTDEDEVIRKKIMRATTDSGPTGMNQEKPEAIANLFQLVRVLCTRDVYDTFDAAYNNCSIRYGDLKKQLAEDTVRFVAPFRERIREILADDAYLEKVRRTGEEKARESARRTLAEVRHIIGF